METNRRTGRSLTLKVDLIIVIALAVGIGGALSTLATSLVATYNRKTQQGIFENANILYTAIESVMLPGQAPLAVTTLSNISVRTPGTKITLYRRDGTLAFSDNKTIETVNSNLKQQKFMLQDRPPVGPLNPPPRFSEASATPPAELFFRDDAAGRDFFRAYRPLINLPKCTVCHGSDHTVRGVIDIRTDVTSDIRTTRTILAGTGGGFIVVVALLALVIGSFLRRVVLDPVQSIGALCAQVAGGKFEGRVEPRSDDEIGVLARTVNTMVEGLYERFELTKYVSAGTIGALKAGQEPQRVKRTLLFTDVRGFTSYTERRGAEEVVAVLNKVLDQQSLIIQSFGGDIDKFVGDEIVAIFSGDDGAHRAFRSALAIKKLCSERSADFDGLAVGIGIAEGAVIQGMVGSSRRADFTVIGDAVNTASRLCSLARQGQIIVSDKTRSAVGSDFDLEG
ncbi:MAG TPA: adenylate/guanylate cyclase domain-containing protein, partial [Rectinemataceae bacterium]|nr:adenylate/guanylate cyclase domain-containing protein [Rectinemataceae bacterium]